MAETIQTDVLVVGGGGAGAREAAEANRAGASVVLATKGRFGATGVRGGGATGISISEATGSHGLGRVGMRGWTAEQVFDDVIQVGLGMADRKMVQILIEDTIDSRNALDEWGIVHPGGQGMGARQHGVPIMDVLHRVIRQSDVRILEQCLVTDLVINDGECVGAVGVGDDGTQYIFQTKAVVLGTGGNGQLFRFNMNPTDVTGDGYSMAYNAGADLMNMEFMQIFLGTVYPTTNLVHSWAWRRGERMTNTLGEEFAANYIPEGGTLAQAQTEHGRHNPFSARDQYSRYLDIGMVNEVVEGRASEHGALNMYLSDPEAIPAELRDWYNYRGIRWEDGPLQVAICHHCSNGGLVIDENAQSTLPRLYAAGEQATGPHGGDRLGGHMLTASQVFGARAGKHAARVAKGAAPTFDFEGAQDSIVAIEAFANSSGDESPAALKSELQHSAWANLLVARSPETLSQVLADIGSIRERLANVSISKPTDVVQALEVRSLLTVGEMVATVAMNRTESRAGHYRVDYPEQNDTDWLKTIKVRRAGSKMELESFAIDPDWTSREGDMGEMGWG